MTFCDAEGWAVFSTRRAMDFTSCFQNSVLTLIPSVILLISLSPRLHNILRKGRLNGVKADAVFYTKMILVIAAFAVQLSILIKIVAQDSFQSSALLSTIVYLVALAGAALLHWFEFFNMANPSAGLLVFWLLTALVSIFPTRSWIQESPDGLSSTLPLLKLIFTIIATLIFLLENVPKPNRAQLSRQNAAVVFQSNPSPEPASNFFTRITFFWVLPLLNLGKKKTLRMDDLWSVHPKLLSYPLYMTTKAKMDADEAIRSQKIKDRVANGDQGNIKEKNRINLLGTVFHAVGYGLLTAIVPKILYIAALYARPILFSDLIAFVDSYTRTSTKRGIPGQTPWIGYGLLIAVFASGLLSTIFDNQFRNICYNVGLKARGVLINLIYRKSLRLSSTSKQEGMGSIVNHMSTDVDKVVQLLDIVHESWSAVLEVTIAIILLYAEVKYAIFASIGVIVVVVVIVGAISPFLGKAQSAFMEQSDHRMKLITETVNYIKSIKLYAWEPYFMNKISETRANQLDKLRHFYSFLAVIIGLMYSLTALCTFTTLAVYSAIAPEDAPLDMRRIFTTITLINMLETPLVMAKESASTIAIGIVSYKRLRGFLSSEEIDDENVQRNADATASEFAYEVQDGTFGWYSLGMIQTATEKKEKDRKQVSKEKGKDEKHGEKRTIVSHGSESSIESLDMESEPSERSSSPSPSSENERDNMGPVLHDINLKIKRGSLTAVVGRVGEGKSSLVGALLGEMYKYKGTVRTYGSLAYVPQSAWIMNDTVRNNILFGRPYDKERYLKTIRACALAPDFKMLVNSDKTLIGEKGINLSGGQKQRISIARAVYADADVYIFDDPLSAVDAHVSDHIFVHVLTTILANKTRILVTNAVNRLQDADQIVVIKQGKISQDGQYNELVQNEEGDLFRLIQESKSIGSNNEEQTDNKASEIDEGSITEDYDEDNSIETASATSEERGSKLVKTKTREEDVDLEAKDEVDGEVTAEGGAGWAVYKFYLSTLSIFGIISFLAIVAVYMGLLFGVQLWLRRWGHDNDTGAPKHSAHYWILTYFGWTLAGALMFMASIAYPVLYMARSASKYLHAAMLKPLIRSPMSFFDVTSSGKIVNRFAHDISAIDTDLPSLFANMLVLSIYAIQIFVFCIAATPYFVVITIPIGFGYYLLGGYFIVSSRELKRLDSAARSPMYAHFSETLAGLTSIRAFQDSDRFAIDATSLLDRSQQTSYLSNATTRWLMLMLNTMSVLIISVVALLAVVQRGHEGAGLFSIVLSQIGVLTGVMEGLLSTACSMETAIISVERVREYSQLTPEARDVIPDSKTDEAWPQTGKIEFNNYSTRYREGLDLVLKDLSLTIQGGERIGIVGRTGAGKSSVTLSLFRIVEAVEGSITIDGIDISTLGLHELRSRITIIPQDPFLFGASIRSNLDPFDKYTDADIWEALESASLKPYIQTLPEGLSTMIDNGGENMSLGQRQLMSLARAMLAKNTRILCLDEATAAIDIETDNAIQRALRRGFSNCTVLTIAHRINTIMDSDRILVLDKGRVAEFDSPKTLLQNKESIFFSLANTSGHA